MDESGTPSFCVDRIVKNTTSTDFPSFESFDETGNDHHRTFRATKREGNEVDDVWSEGGLNFDNEYVSNDAYPSNDDVVNVADFSSFDAQNIYPKAYATSPFESAVESEPSILSYILDFIGDPVSVCRLKIVNKSCCNFIEQNEHKLLQNAVRLGGMSMNMRPRFWLWVTLQSRLNNQNSSVTLYHSTHCLFENSRQVGSTLQALERSGRDGKWSCVIQRDVTRAFGNLPPHKTGARLRTDSIVRALVSWGRSKIVRRGVKDRKSVRRSQADGSTEEDEQGGIAPKDTVSDWGCVTPVGSFSSSLGSVGSGGISNDDVKAKPHSKVPSMNVTRDVELVLNGNSLTDETKAELQGELSFILHCLAASHPEVGYCQGMDYVVAHLLRILKETILWKAANGTLSTFLPWSPIYSERRDNGQNPDGRHCDVDKSLIVEEICFRVMDSFFTVYSLRHFYWPELRCLKTCCRVFEKIIQIKLPVLADHLEHQELNVGLFALGWFQTLFLYLPSMPSATVCHMWDIWLIERSYKIFFRVATAILFLSQPILLNNELEGMMHYLNTFPDATLLSPDILIACALQIKVTNRMLMELEQEVVDRI